jgi:hypothetical protein
MADRSTKYIAYCRARCAPRLGAEAALLLQNHYVSIRSDVRARSKDGSNSTVPITVRQLEAIVRISESLAKMTLNRNVRVLFVLFSLFSFLFCFSGFCSTVVSFISSSVDRRALPRLRLRLSSPARLAVPTSRGGRSCGGEFGAPSSPSPSSLRSLLLPPPAARTALLATGLDGPRARGNTSV